MKWFYRLIFLVLLLASILGAAGAQDSPGKASIEVVMEGKSYPSMHAYQLDQLKSRMKEGLSGIPLEEFDDHELISILGELRQEQAISKDDKGEEMRLMEGMLEEYEEKHPQAPDLMLNQKKMKTITIP